MLALELKPPDPCQMLYHLSLCGNCGGVHKFVWQVYIRNHNCARETAQHSFSTDKSMFLINSPLYMAENVSPETLTSDTVLIHTQNTASAPSHPIQHPTAGTSTHMTPVGLVMAGCCQISYILTNIGRRNSIRILNQHPLFWNILIWTQFICLSIFLHFKH